MQNQNARHVRQNAQNRLRSSNRIANVLYTFTYAVLTGQLIAALVVIQRTWDDECDVNLRMWMVAHAVRTGLYLPITAYDHKTGPIEEDDVANMSPRHRRFQMLKTIFEIGALFVFVLGNSLLFAADTCDETSPELYKTTLAFIIIGYIGLALPLLLCILLLFCFPCVMVLVSRMTRAMPGAAEEVEKRLKDLPTATFNENGNIAEDDAVCAICTDEYKAGVDIVKLPCSHHFHADCATTWLRLNPTCPICRHSVLDDAPERNAGARVGVRPGGNHDDSNNNNNNNNNNAASGDPDPGALELEIGQMERGERRGAAVRAATAAAAGGSTEMV